MTDNTIYSMEVIQDTPLPTNQPVVPTTSSQQTGNEVYGQETIQNQELPTPHVAQELISEKLNTRTQRILKEFQFTPSGALQIGNYQQGVSGDIRISPDGILGRNSLGDTTFALDGETGDAIFAGTIEAGTFVAGAVIVGDNNVILDGGNKRLLISDGVTNRILIGYQKNGF